jgi:hypothetical protein
MVIVTQNQYLLASKIYHITLDENMDYVDYRENGRISSKLLKKYVISIIYAPETTSLNDQRECTITILSAIDAHKIFRDLVEQIREQNPDQLYLDRALEKMLSGVDITYLTSKDKADKIKKQMLKRKRKGHSDDRSTKKVRKSRKAKRRN